MNLLILSHLGARGALSCVLVRKTVASRRPLSVLDGLYLDPYVS
jgi:hypothetical protein